MPPTELVPPIAVELDLPVTRRIKVHAVVDGNGDQVFHAKRISEVFAYLLEHQICDLVLLDDDAEFRITLHPPASPPSKKKG